ncbi:neutral zinc metallopeptidase [Actinomycetaceae bacterium MB13-C1-2]|nr:neutral zinc metallopeptidase [Actinomycetaceae bacterium MB13-C1-2]
MTFNPNADVSTSKATRRGHSARNTGFGVGAVGVIVLLVSLFTGHNFTGLTPMITGMLDPDQDQVVAASESVIEDCATGQDANEDDACRLAASQLALDDYWAQHVKGYTPATMIIYDGSTMSACGQANNSVGPFYCPADRGVYIDPAFFQLMRQDFGASAGNLAQIYIVSHEWGHHIQNITGISDAHSSRASGADSDSVRIELQADCFAGAFIKDMTTTTDVNGQPYLLEPTKEQLVDALNAAASVGDDHIQEQATGRVQPESFTHGTSEQRQKWFTSGYTSGIGGCDTFAVSGSEL